jgi:hypothetical protein
LKHGEKMVNKVKKKTSVDQDGDQVLILVRFHTVTNAHGNISHCGEISNNELWEFLQSMDKSCRERMDILPLMSCNKTIEKIFL